MLSPASQPFATGPSQQKQGLSCCKRLVTHLCMAMRRGVIAEDVQRPHHRDTCRCSLWPVEAVFVKRHTLITKKNAQMHGAVLVAAARSCRSQAAILP
jgi:hypothetical protein